VRLPNRGTVLKNSHVVLVQREVELEQQYQEVKLLKRR
jgi:hypothetical protein